MDPMTFRSRFPIFSSKIYVASCSQGALSNAVEEAIHDELSRMREEGAPWPYRQRMVQAAREKIASWIKAAPDEIALLPSATVAMYQILSRLRQLPHPLVVSVISEFPTIAHVLQAQGYSSQPVRFLAPPTPWDTEQFFAQVPPDCTLLSVPLVDYGTGTCLPLPEIVVEAHRRGIEVVSDVYQAVGVIPIDVHAWDIDYVIGGTLKYLLGVPGLGFAYIRRDKIATLVPHLTGWHGRVDPAALALFPLDWAPAARRLELGTPAVLAHYAVVAGMASLEEIRVDTIFAHVRGLVCRLHEALIGEGIPLLSPSLPEHLGPMVLVEQKEPQRLAQWLAAHDIIAAPRGRGVRLSFHYYNIEDDLRTILAALRQWRDQGYLQEEP